MLRWLKSKLFRSLANPDPWLLEAFGVRATASGENVSPTTAMGLSAYFGAIRSISEDVAKLPLWVYRRLKPQGKQREPGHHVYKLLNSQPNPCMTAITFRQTLLGHALSMGNGYAEIERDHANRPIALWPLPPERVTPKLADDGRSLTYILSQTGGNRVLQSQDVFHILGLSLDGLTGVSVAHFAKECLGLALASQKAGAALFGAGSRPGGVLTMEGCFGDKAGGIEAFREEWERVFGGAGNTGIKTAILQHGMEYKPIAVAHRDSQWIESRQFSIEEICRWFRMQPNKLQHWLRSTFNNVFEANLDHVVDCLQPWAVRFEQEVSRKLLSPSEQSRLFVEHLFDSLLRGDPKSRNEALQIQRRNGIINGDDWCAIENRNPLPDGQGQVYIVEKNMVNLKAMGGPTAVKDG